MRLVVIFGPPAVGKMTVGVALARRTGLRLFHNHMTIDLVRHFFEFGEAPFGRLVSAFRQQILEEVAASELPGLIFTYVWALDHPGDREQIDAFCAPFRARGAEIYFVELQASQEERLRRNATPYRLAQKPSKRDVTGSAANLRQVDRDYRLHSDGDFFYPENHVVIDNTRLSPEEVAARIMDVFGWEPAASVAVPPLLRPPGAHVAHVALWTTDLERLRGFYESYCGAVAGARYENRATGFTSYFLDLPGGGARLELMSGVAMGNRPVTRAAAPGYAHVAIAVGSGPAVDDLAARIQRDGYPLLDGPRWTGDGYYEAVVADPDGNRVEITI